MKTQKDKKENEAMCVLGSCIIGVLFAALLIIGDLIINY
jgi:hypothetical protein